MEAPGVSAATTDDTMLLYALARGDRQALAGLYARHAEVMLALSLRILRDPGDAEDAVHDAFVEAWEHAGDYDPARASVRGWLLLRLRSRCLDRVRAGIRRRALLESNPPLAGAEHGGDAANRSDHGRVRSALSRLSDEQRAVVELGYFHGLSSQEIADALGIPVGTVKSRVSAAIMHLRRALDRAEAREVSS